MALRLRVKDARFLVALTAALERLAEAEAGRDEEGIWAATREALEWLYACEEAEKAAIPDYYEDRNGTESGRTVAGLIWVRGLTMHHQAEVRRLLWLQARTFVMVGGKFRPARTSVRVDGQWKETTPHVASARWPAVGLLPEGTMPARGRDRMYEDHVSEKPVMEPLQTALDYFAAKT